MIKRFFSPVLLLFLSFFAVLGCHQKTSTPPLAAPEVVVEAVQVRNVQPYITTTGTTDAFEFVEIYARVSGFLQEIRYTDGEIVAANAPLFLIQPDQYEAAVKAAEGSLAAAHAQLNLMEADLVRTQSLFDNRTYTKQDLDTAIARRDEAASRVTQAEAQLDLAKLDLSYTDIRSPIVGKVNPHIVDIGNLVGPSGNHNVLTTVAGMNPIFVNFDISDAQFNEIRTYARDHKTPVMEGFLQQIHSAKENEGTATQQQQREGASVDGFEEFQIPFEISLIAGSAPETGEYPFKGIVDTVYNRIDPSTGTITVRGKIPNADYGIFPGQICRVRIPIWQIRDALLVRQEAIGTDMHHRYVYVVDEQNTVHRRIVELGMLQPDGTRVITKGLEAGERYVVSGIQKVRDGSQVKVK